VAGRPRISEWARYGLAAIRLFNGTVALIAPARLSRRLGVDPDANPGAIYAFRLFGIRTVVIGAELLLLDGEDLDRSLRNGVLIHVSDTLAAVGAGASRQMPAQPAMLATLISSINTGLALAARQRDRD
jgi:hypothetical protein